MQKKTNSTKYYLKNISTSIYCNINMRQFNVNICNISKNRNQIAICKWMFCFEVIMMSSNGKVLSSLKDYLRDGDHNLQLATEEDWIVLDWGEAISLPVYALDRNGIVAPKKGYTVRVIYDLKKISEYMFVENQMPEYMKRRHNQYEIIRQIDFGILKI